MRTRRHIVYAVLIAIVLMGYFVFVKSSATLKGSAARSSDILRIEKYYTTLTNCSILVTQQNSRIGTLNGIITIKSNADISVEWQEHQNDIGDFSHKIYKDGVAAIWEKIYKNDESVKTPWPSLISALDSAQASSHDVSYLIPAMLLGKESLGDPSLWKPVSDKKGDKNECALENKKNLVSFVIFYDAKTFRIIKTTRRITTIMGIFVEETAYVESKNN